jgi:hypothetical protein
MDDVLLALDRSMFQSKRGLVVPQGAPKILMARNRWFFVKSTSNLLMNARAAPTNQPYIPFRVHDFFFCCLLGYSTYAQRQIGHTFERERERERERAKESKTPPRPMVATDTLTPTHTHTSLLLCSAGSTRALTCDASCQARRASAWACRGSSSESSWASSWASSSDGPPSE